MTPSAIRSRARRERERQAIGKERRAWSPIPEELKAVPRHERDYAKRFEYKQKKVLARGGKLRHHDAHVKAWRKYRAEHRLWEGFNAHVSEWKRSKYAAFKAEEFRQKYRNDPEFNAKQKLRARLRKIATIDGHVAAYLSYTIKRRSMWEQWVQLLGYSTEQLIQRLQSTMPIDATWADFLSGALHIDHIRPRASFDLTDVEQVRQCWALDNLQLLWAEDNRRKAAKWEQS